MTSQFSNCPLIWMFHSRGMGHRINKFYKRALPLIYSSDSKLAVKELLDKNKTMSIHRKILLLLANEIQSKAQYFTRYIKIVVFY